MDPHSLTLITTLLILIFSAIIGGIAAHKLKLPMVLGYIISGFLVGNIIPSAVNGDFINVIADAGVVLLLFTLGIEFSFHRLRHAMKSLSLLVIVQMIATMFIIFTIALLFQMGTLLSLFLAVAASLSSTAIVMKILSEHGEEESNPGKMVSDWLILQDLAVVPIMIILPAFVSLYQSGNSTVLGNIFSISISIIKSGAAIVVVLFLGRVGVPKFFSCIASIGAREAFVVSIIGFVFVFSVLFDAIGLSAGLGAFIAGLLISDTTQNHAIFSEIRPLRDIFSVVFFIALGMVLPLQSVIALWQPILLWSIFIMLVKFFIIYTVTRFVGTHQKTSFIVSISLTILSEFGFIIAKEGASLGVLDSESYILIVAITFVSIIFGSPLLSRVHTVYYSFHRIVSKLFPRIFPILHESSLKDHGLAIQDHVVLCGYGRVGKYIGRALEMADIPFVVVEYNNIIVKKIKEKNIQVVYGDPADIDVLDYAQVDKARVVIVAIPDRHTQEMVIGNVLTLNKHCRIICRSHHEEDQIALKTLGVSSIVQPEFEAALAIAERLLGEYTVPEEEIAGKISRLKIEHGMG